MNPYLFPLALLGFAAFVALVPAFTFFVTEWTHLDGVLSSQTQFLAALVLPATAAMFFVSWVQS